MRRRLAVGGKRAQPALLNASASTSLALAVAIRSRKFGFGMLNRFPVRGERQPPACSTLKCRAIIAAKVSPLTYLAKRSIDCASRGVLLVEAQTMQNNAPALTLYQKLGFRKVDEGIVYRKDA